MSDPQKREKHEPATKWKLVEMRCEALTDAAKSARVPFVLALLWAFVWSVSTYTATIGYLQSYQSRYQRLLTEVFATEFRSFGIACTVEPDNYSKQTCTLGAVVSPPPNASDDLSKACKKIDHALDKATDAQNLAQKVRDCAQEMANRINRTVEQLQKEYMLTLPGFSPVLHDSDLGIVGGMGLVLILLWLFFAVRRENHAIASFVDISPVSNHLARPWAHAYVVTPQEKYWSAEHYAFAYSAVSQRFMFLFSTHSILLQSFAVFLAGFPAIVASISFIVDAYTGFDIMDKLKDLSIAMRLLVQLVLLAGIVVFTAAVIRYVISSNRLLNAWYMATRDVWMDEWDETNQRPASKVLVDVVRGVATEMTAKAMDEIASTAKPMG